MKTLSEVKAILSGCTRSELRDHAFGDVEISWTKDGKMVAEGYFGGGGPVVASYCCCAGDCKCGSWEFSGKAAVELRKCGTLGEVERNDETGPDTYAEGVCLPGLTLDGVRKELCEDDD
jgi:hypothetical protein